MYRTVFGASKNEHYNNNEIREKNIKIRNDDDWRRKLLGKNIRKIEVPR